MSSPTVDIEESTDGPFVAEIPPGRTFRDSLWNAVKLGSIFGGFIGLGFNVYVSFGLLDREPGDRKDPYTISEVLTEQTETLLPITVGLFVLVALGLGAYKLWKQLPLTGSRSVRIEEGRLTFAKDGLLGEQRVYSGDLAEVDLVQHSEIPRSTLAGEVEPERNHEVTLATDDGLYVLASGLDGEQSARLAESLEQALHDRRSSPARDG